MKVDLKVVHIVTVGPPLFTYIGMDTLFRAVDSPPIYSRTFGSVVAINGPSLSLYTPGFSSRKVFPSHYFDALVG